MKKILLLVILFWYCVGGHSMAFAEISGHVVISEIKTSGGTGKTTDEFIELYNPTGAPVNLHGWVMVKKTASGSDYVLVDTFGDKTIPANGYFLIAHPTGYGGSVTPDVVYSTANSISDNNTLVLKNQMQETVDQIGYGTATVVEGKAASNPASSKSLERKAKPDSTTEYMIDGGRDYFAGNGEDNNNNKNDFIIRETPEPQNSLNEPELVTAAAPTVPITNGNTAPTNSVPANVNVNKYTSINTNTVSAPAITAPSQVVVIAPEAFDYSKKIVLNELFPACAGADEDCEFIEIYNDENRQVKLAGWALTDKKVRYRFTDSAVIPAHGYVAIKRSDTKIALNNTGKDIFLQDPAGKIISGVEYGSAKEDQAFARTLDGKGWRWTEKSTPGARNEFTEDGDELIAPSSVQDTASVKSINTAATNQDLQPVEIASIDEGQIGKIVVASGMVDSVSGRSFYLVDDEGNSIRVYVPKKPGLETLTVKAGDTISVTGEVSKTDAGLRIVPRTKSDIIVSSNETVQETGEVLGESIEQNKAIPIPAEKSNSQVVTYIIVTFAVAIAGVAIYIWKTKHTISAQPNK